MNQDIITLIVVLAAVIYTTYKFLKNLLAGKKSAAHCNGCSGCAFKTINN